MATLCANSPCGPLLVDSREPPVEEHLGPGLAQEVFHQGGHAGWGRVVDIPVLGPGTESQLWTLIDWGRSGKNVPVPIFLRLRQDTESK